MVRKLPLILATCNPESVGRTCKTNIQEKMKKDMSAKIKSTISLWQKMYRPLTEDCFHLHEFLYALNKNTIKLNSNRYNFC